MTASTAEPFATGDGVALDIRNLRHAFGANRVLLGVELTMRRAEILGLVGANGAGKSTVAQILAGGLQPDEGEISLRGQRVRPTSHHQARAAGIGIIEQRFELDPKLRVAQALYRHTDRAGDPLPELYTAARRILIAAGVAIDPGELLGDLSRSELGMVEAVRLLVDPQPVTVIDEVSATFNPREIDELRYILSRLTGAGRSAIYITHQLDEARAICDRIAVLRHGRIVETFVSSLVSADDLAAAMFGAQVAAPVRRATATADVLLSVRGLDCGGERPVAFDLRSGEIAGIVATRGGGVERLVGALTGDDPQPTMSLTLAGDPVRITTPRDAVDLRIAYLTSQTVPGRLSADDSFARSLLVGSLGPEDDFVNEWAAIANVVTTLREAGKAARGLFPGTALSEGQGQWVRLRETAALDSRVLVLDEPTRALDLRTQVDLGDLLGRSVAEGRSALVVSANASDLLALTDRIIVLHDGSIRAVWDSRHVTAADVDAVLRGVSPLAEAEPVDAVCTPEVVFTGQPH